MLSTRATGSRAFWSLAKAIESNFCQPLLPALLKPDGSLTHTATETANVFAFLFAQNSHLDTGNASPACLLQCGISMPEIRITKKEVWRALCRLDVNKASGPDDIPFILLKTCAAEWSPVLTRLYRLSSKTEVVPKSWKLANVEPVPKKWQPCGPCQ